MGITRQHNFGHRNKAYLQQTYGPTWSYRMACPIHDQNCNRFVSLILVDFKKINEMACQIE